MRFLFISIVVIISSLPLSAGKIVNLSESVEANDLATKEYRIDLIIFKNNSISETSLKEIFDTPDRVDFASNLIEISKIPKLLVTTQSVNTKLLIKEPQINNLRPIVPRKMMVSSVKINSYLLIISRNLEILKERFLIQLNDLKNLKTIQYFMRQVGINHY